MRVSEGSPLSRRRFLQAAGGSGAIALAGCTEGRLVDPGTDGLSGTISISGSSTVFPLMVAISEEFTREHSEVRIDVNRTGTGGGFSEHFCPGNTEFNNASRPIRPAEAELCEAGGVEYIEFVGASDALTVGVNNDADWIDCLTVEELARIFERDAVDTWDELRPEWPAEPIERYGPTDATGTYDYFIEHVQGEDRGHTSDYQATEKDNTIIQGIAGDRYAIGYFGFSFFYQNPDTVTPVGIDNGDGCILPTLETAAERTYEPLSRPLITYLSKPALEHEHVEAFARFFIEQSTSEEIIAERVGYVPNTEEVKNEQLEKLETALDER